jgi:hypothetical protein
MIRISPLSENVGRDVAIFGGHLREGGGDVDFGHGGGGGANALGMRGGELAHLAEQLFFEREDLVLGVENLALVVLQLGRGEALGVDQGLLALVIGGGEVLVGLGDFDVIAEHIIEADLQRLDAGAGALASFDLRDVPGGRCG